MSSPGSILAEIRLIPTEQGGRRMATAPHRFGCPVGIGDKLFDMVIDLTSIGSLSPGQTARVTMQFRRPDLAFPLLHVGSEFTLWELGTIGHGTVIEMYEKTAA